MRTDRADTTSFGSLNKESVQGLPDINGTLAGFWDDTEEKIFTGRDSTDGVKLYLYPNSDAPTKYWYGPAWIDYDMETRVNDAVKLTASFAANGDWGRK